MRSAGRCKSRAHLWSSCARLIRRRPSGSFRASASFHESARRCGRDSGRASSSEADARLPARAAAGCQACPLWKRGTQTVFGEGPLRADLLLVGEQPSDREDVEGRPFVGPAGRLLDVCLDRAGIDRSKVYVTNVVKHFKWEPRGKKRIHQKPNSSEIAACRPWLEAEIAVIRPRALVCLGATAAQAVFGRSFRVTKSRGRILASPLAPLSAATIHPSSILRAPDSRTRHRETERFVRDLAQVARALNTRGR